MTNDVSDKNCLKEYAPQWDRYNESAYLVLQDYGRSIDSITDGVRVTRIVWKCLNEDLTERDWKKELVNDVYQKMVSSEYLGSMTIKLC